MILLLTGGQALDRHEGLINGSVGGFRPRLLPPLRRETPIPERRPGRRPTRRRIASPAARREERGYRSSVRHGPGYWAQITSLRSAAGACAAAEG